MTTISHSKRRSMYKVEMEVCRSVSEDEWVTVFFCAWLSVNDAAGAVVEWNDRPVWVPLDRLRFKGEKNDQNT